MSAQITELRVGDEHFLVTSMIDRCPKSMMLRELVRNAIEAAQTAPPGERRVEISGIDIDGAPKLVIWNSGRGMDSDELFRMCDIASSIRKQNAIDQNFGMGAKVASLPSNRFGMRYRSCHAGRVCEVMIGQRDGVYGRLRRAQPGSAALCDVLDATEAALAEGRPLGRDWTEVVLLGNHAGQNTQTDPYHGEPAMPACWIAEELHKKFFRLPEDVELILQPRANVSGAAVRFRSLFERLEGAYSRHEAVGIAGGVVVHYIYDAPLEGDPERSRASVGAPYPVHGFAGLVYKDEIYDLCWNQHWLHDGPVYGVPFLGRNITVLVEFPADHPVLPDGYRQFLRRSAGLQGQILLRQFAREVHLNRPAWLVELIGRNAPESVVGEEITASLERLLRELAVPRRARLVPATGRSARPVRPAGPAAPDAAAAPSPAAPSPAASPAAAAGAAGFEMRRDEEASDFDYEWAPQILMLRDAAQAQARGLAERGARYYGETHQLFVNCLYPAVQAMQTSLEQEFAWAEDQEAVRRAAQVAAEQSMVSRVGRMLIFGLSKQGRWPEWELNHSLSTQALTLAADDYHQSLPAARASLRASLRLRQLSQAAG